MDSGANYDGKDKQVVLQNMARHTKPAMWHLMETSRRKPVLGRSRNLREAQNWIILGGEKNKVRW